MIKLRTFNTGDWLDFGGAEIFLDGSAPLIGYYGTHTYVIVDKHGVQAFFWSNDGGILAQVDIPVCKEFGILIANKILYDIDGMTNDQVIEYLNAHGREL